MIDARLVSGESGGVEAVVAGLAHGLSQLDGPEEYLFVVWPDHGDWLAPYVSGPARLAVVDFDPPIAPSLFERAEQRARRMAGLPPREHDPDARIPRVDPRIEALRPTLVHMPRQLGFLTSVPSIYHPHDLQHVHLPQFFSAKDRAWRERVYGRLCRRAAMVAVASEWTRTDIVGHFRLDHDKVRVVTLAPPLEAARTPTPAERAATRARFDLPPEYALYPAQTWPHKNHIRLLEALSKLRDESGIVVPLVATGTRNAHFTEIAAASSRLGLDSQIRWTGFVSAVELQAIYLEARAVVVPSLFEAASAPLWEAFLAGVPAACSNVTSLPDQAGDAAVVFDPERVDAMAQAIAAVWSDEPLRRRLVDAGRKRVASLSWERTARTFRAHYRRLAGEALLDADLALIGDPA